MEKTLKLISGISIAVVLVGIYFACTNLDKKFFWYDERLTLFRISGHTTQEMEINHPYESVFQVKDLDVYRRYNRDTSWKDTVRSLRNGEGSMHTPGYFLLAREWCRRVGSSIPTVRSMSVFFFIASLPLVFWLIQLLTGSKKLASLTLALFSISPLFLLYAQEARPYMLWTFLFLFSWLALLKALPASKNIYWYAYALSILIGLYVQPFMLLGIIGQGFYVILLNKSKIKEFLIAASTASLLFLPWLIPQISNANNIAVASRWTFRTLPLNLWATRMIINPGLVIFDPGWYSYQYLSHPLALSIYVIIGLSYIFLFGLCFKQQRQLALFLFSVCFIPILILTGKDFILGGQLATVPRYLLPFNIGLLCLLAFGLDRLLRRSQIQGVLAYLGLIALALFSSYQIHTAEFWWTKYSSHYYSLQKIIQHSAQPILITNAPLVSLIYIDIGLPPQTKIYRAPFDFKLPYQTMKGDLFLYTDMPFYYPRLHEYFEWQEIPLLNGIPSFGRLYKLIKP